MTDQQLADEIMARVEWEISHDGLLDDMVPDRMDDIFVEVLAEHDAEDRQDAVEKLMHS